MGKFIYGTPSIAVDFDDRVLAHLKIVILSKVRQVRASPSRGSTPRRPGAATARSGSTPPSPCSSTSRAARSRASTGRGSKNSRGCRTRRRGCGPCRSLRRVTGAEKLGRALSTSRRRLHQEIGATSARRRQACGAGPTRSQGDRDTGRECPLRRFHARADSVCPTVPPRT